MKIDSKIIRIIGTFIIIEFCLQLVTFGRYAWGQYSQKQAENDIVARTWALRDPTFRAVFNEESNVWEEYYPFVGWRTREMHTPHINVSADGIRTTVGNSATVAGLPTIYFLGGSAMWGEGLTDDTTIPSLVVKQLNSQSPAAAVFNYGEIGYVSTQEVLRLALLLKSGKRPDHVIFYDGCNDFFVSALDSRVHETYRDDRMKSVLGNIWALPDDSETVRTHDNTTIFSTGFWQQVFSAAIKYIQIIRYPMEIYNTLHHDAISAKPQGSVSDAGKTEAIANNYVENIRLVDALSQTYHFDYLLFWQPTVYSYDLTPEERNLPGIHPDRYTQFSRMYHDAAQIIGQKLGGKFIDLSRIYEGTKGPIFTDSCHVTVEGNRTVSERIAKELQSAWGFR